MNPQAKVLKSYRDGHIRIHLSGSANHYDTTVSATVAVDLDLETTRAFHAKIGAAIKKEAAKIKAYADREVRRKAWRDREIAAGRMKVMSAAEFFGK